MFQSIKQFIFSSPFISISLLATLWLGVRGLVYQIDRFWFFDIPTMIGSPVSIEYSVMDTSLIVFAIGEIAAIIALFRKRERFRLNALLILPLNFMIWLWLVEKIIWAIAPPPGIDY